MKPVFHDPDPTRVGYARSILESEGIPCFVRNEYGHIMGQTMFAMVQAQIFEPTLCVIDDSQAGAAQALLKERLAHGTQSREVWTCPSCEETVPASFEICWNCQTPDPLLKLDPNDPSP